MKPFTSLAQIYYALSESATKGLSQSVSLALSAFIEYLFDGLHVSCQLQVRRPNLILCNRMHLEWSDTEEENMADSTSDT